MRELDEEGGSNFSKPAKYVPNDKKTAIPRTNYTANILKNARQKQRGYGESGNTRQEIKNAFKKKVLNK